jgi:hypothetical protein
VKHALLGSVDGTNLCSPGVASFVQHTYIQPKGLSDLDFLAIQGLISHIFLKIYCVFTIDIS